MTTSHPHASQPAATSPGTPTAGPATRAAFVAVVGLPNAGKSTLVNRLIGTKLSIVSPKPQTTRDRVVGILTTDSAQLIFLDTPGLLKPKYALQRALQHAALAALDDADLVLHVAAAPDARNETPNLWGAAAGAKPPSADLRILLALNKVDLLPDQQRSELRGRYPDAHLVSATTGEGLEGLLESLVALAPESPFLYPPDDVSSQSQRFFVAELVRESAIEQLEDELPYSVACEIEEFRESASPVYIRAVLHVERESQKHILIGAKGQRVRAIGESARRKIETFLEARVYLDLWVKVLPNWRRNAHALERLGYHLPPAGEQPS